MVHQRAEPLCSAPATPPAAPHPRASTSSGAVVPPRKPIFQTLPACCAPAATGTASTAPRPVTKARRFIGLILTAGGMVAPYQHREVQVGSSRHTQTGHGES